MAAGTRAIVTGAAGFIGANLARRLLADGHDVKLCVGPGTDRWRLEGLDAEICLVDLTDAAAVDALFDRVRPEWIFHLAAHGAYSWQQDVRRIVEVNVTGAAHLLESAQAAGFEAFVNAGSSSEYGEKTAAPREDEVVDPNSTYAVAKAAATMLFRHFSITRELPMVTLRLYSAYGAWEDPRRLVPALVLRGLEGGLPPLVDPSVARDFVHVDDVVEAFVLAASRPTPLGAIYNIATGVQTTIGEAVDVVRRVLAVSEEPAWGSLDRREWDTTTWVGDPSKAAAELGWRASYSFEEGFAATVEWARETGWPAQLT